MKRDDLKALNIPDEAIDRIMALHGADIETHKTQVSVSKTQIDTLTAQLSDANKQIESFKGLDIEGVKKSADEYKAKFEAAQQEHAAQISQIKFDTALETALAGAKVKNTKAAKALLSIDGLKLQEDGTIYGLKEQLEKVKSENDYLFDSATPPPTIVKGGNPKTVIGDPVIDAARRAAGLPDPK